MIDFYRDIKDIMFRTKAAVKVLVQAREMVIVGQSKIRVTKAHDYSCDQAVSPSIIFTLWFLWLG